MLPFLGAAAVWLPVTLSLALSGLSQGSNPMLYKAFFMLLYGTFLVSLVDNFLKPKLIGEGARIHPGLILLGILGGLAMFGFIGIVIGPVLVALFKTFIEIYESGNWK